MVKAKAIKRLRTPTARRRAAGGGTAAGRMAGWNAGYHLGRCESIVRHTPPEHGEPFDIRLLYVTTGLGIPFSPLDQANLDALRGMVRELIVATPNDDVPAIAAQTRPDLMIVFNGHIFPIQKTDAVRAMGIRTAIWFTDDPYAIDGTVRLALHYDDVFTLELSCVPVYRECGCERVHYLPLGMSPNVFRPKTVGLPYRHDVCIIGSAYWNRVRYFDRIARYLASRNVYISGIWWKRLKHYRLLSRRIHHGWMSPEQTADYYAGAKIVINLHRAHDLDYNMNSRNIPALSPNPRMFEIAGSGALQLTDMRQDIGSFYTPGRDIVVYTSPQDLAAKIEHYLKYEAERREIALNALQRTLHEHTYAKRWRQLLQTVFAQSGS